MARGLTVGTDRRSASRVAPDCTMWPETALLRPGLDVVIINLSTGGALVESFGRLKPGARTELQLLGRLRCVVGGCIARCRVIGLDPKRYEAAITFDERFELLSRD